MLSYLTKTKLCEWFLEVADRDRKIESLRIALCKNQIFEPYAAFKRIIRQKRLSIEYDDLQRFLKENDVFVTDSAVIRYMTHYSEHSSTQLNYSEYLRIVLPVSDQRIRTITTQRPNYDVDLNECLHLTVEDAQATLISYEISAYDELSISLKNLMSRPDYNVGHFFHYIDYNHEGVLNFHNLKRFFLQQGLVPFEEEVIEILRRFDKDDDGTINLTEFKEFIGLCLDDFGSQLIKYESPIRNKGKIDRFLKSSEFESRETTQFVNMSAHLYPKVRNFYPTKEVPYSDSKYSVGRRVNQRDNDLSYKNFLREQSKRKLIEKNLEEKGEFVNRPKSIGRSNRQASSTGFETFKGDYSNKFHNTVTFRKPQTGNDDQFIDYVTKACMYEREQEVVKQNLCLRADFICIDNFRLIDKNGTGYLSKNNVLSFCEKLDLPVTPAELDIMFDRYDVDRDGQQSYSEFLWMVTPYEGEYANLLNMRQAKNQNMDYDFFGLYSPVTKEDIKTLWVFLFDTEKKLGLVRATMPVDKPSVTEMFENIDSRMAGKINKPEFLKFLQQNGAPVSAREMSLQFRRFNRDSDEYLRQNDFFVELL